jgi:hypothetical protein
MRITFHVDARGSGSMELTMGGDGVDPIDSTKRIKLNPGLDEDTAR